MESKTLKSFISILFVAAIDSFGFSIVFVMFAPLLLSPEYHFLPVGTSVVVRNLYLGILFAAFPLTQFLGAPFWGDYADQAGRAKAFYLTITGVFFGFIFSGIAALLSSLSLLIISRLITGFFSGNLSICLSAIADLSPSEKQRSRNFGILTAVLAISWNSAMLVGGYLSDQKISKFFGPSVPFWVTAILTILSLFAIWKFFTETHETIGKPSLSLTKGFHHILFALKITAVRPFFIVILLWTIGWGLSVQWFGTYSILVHQASQLAISWSLLIQGMFWLIGGALVNPLLLKRFHTLAIGIIGFSFMVVFLLFATFSASYFIFCLFYFIAATFASFSFSSSMSLASLNAPEAVQGKIMGLSQSISSIGWIIVPIIGGYVGGTNAQWFYPISAVFVFAGLAILVTKRLRNPYES